MRKLLPFLFIPFLFSCIDEDKPDSLIYEGFSFSADQDYFGSYEEGFVILHEQDGTPIDFKKINSGATVSFQVDKSKKHHVTLILLKDLGFQGQPSANIKTWVDQDLLENINLISTDSNTDNTNYSYDGTFDVNITNSNPITSIISSAKGYATTPNSFSNSVNATMVSYLDVDRYLAVAYSKSGESRYQFIDNPEKDKSYELNYADMLEFDQVLKFPLTDYAQLTFNISAINTQSIDKSKGFVISPSNWSFKPEEFYEIGFIGEIDNYLTKIYGRKAANPKMLFQYEKLGTAPSRLETLDIDEIEILKYQITDFEIGTMIPGTTFSSNFRVPNGILNNAGFTNFNWEVFSENSMKFKIELPEELKSKYNLMDILPAVAIDKVTIKKQLYEKVSESDPFYEYTQLSQYF